MSQSTDYSLANQAGAAFRSELNSIMAAIQSLNSGATGPTNPVAHMLWMDSGNNIIKKRDAANSNWREVLKFSSDLPIPYIHDLPYDLQETAWSDGDATPDCSGGVRYKTANSGSTTVTALEDGLFAGQRASLRVADANTIIDGALTLTGRTIVCQADDYLEWEWDGAAWNQVGGTVGMGTRFVPVVDPDAIGDWIAGTVTSPTDVDVSDDGVRKGAVAVHIKSWVSGPSTGGGTAIWARRNGSSDTSNGAIVGQAYNGTGVTFASSSIVVGVDDDGVLEAWFGTSVGAPTSNVAYVNGYWI